MKNGNFCTIYMFMSHCQQSHWNFCTTFDMEKKQNNEDTDTTWCTKLMMH